MNLNINNTGRDGKVGLVTKEDLDKGPEKGPGYVLNLDGGEPNLPDVPKLLDQIIKILEYISSDEAIKMKNKDQDEFLNHMEEKFADFSFRYYAIFRKLLSGEDILPLFKMLAEIEKVQKGVKTLDTVEKELGEELANKYVYSKIKK